MSQKKKKIRAAFRKNRAVRTREHDLTRQLQDPEYPDDRLVRAERISGKGQLSRRRTVVASADESAAGAPVQLDVDRDACLPGRVLRVGGLRSTVQAADGRLFQCATRRLLKTLSTDQRHVLAAGDRVLFRPAGVDEGIIQRVEPRHGELCRTIRGRRQVLVANVDQLLIVSSAAEPMLKPNLIDRLLITAEKNGIRPLICINKVDLVHPADLQPLAGVYGQMGYEVLLLSATAGVGVPRLRNHLRDRESVLLGQSGVGKSSLLNAIQPGLHLEVRSVSAESQKGRHTTTSARLIPLAMGGFVVDTPGIRQFQLWDVIPEEITGFCRDLRPFVSLCRFPDCTHTHEADCAVKHAVADGRIDARRYESYCQLLAGEEP